MKLTNFIFLIIIFFFTGCTLNDKSNSFLNSENEYNKAVELYESENFSKALDKFKYIVSNNPGSLISMKAQFYLAQSLYRLERYDDASSEYDRYILVSQNPEKVEEAKYYICKCFVNMSSDYNRDQEASKVALDRLQFFVEQYPTSIYYKDCENQINIIREKLAKKEFESGKLYMRMEEFEPAILYFKLIVENYYDTDYYDRSLINIVLSYIMLEKHNEAESFLKLNENEFLLKENYLIAKNLLKKRKKDIGFIDYLQLIK